MQVDDVGVVGLGVMGQGLALNIARNGYRVAGYDRDVAQAKQFVVERAQTLPVRTSETLAALVENLASPRRIFIMVPAGSAVDAVVEQLQPLLVSDDIIIDCGNSHFKQTQRRQELLTQQGIHFLGMGVSGGAQGVLDGPSLMPGGELAAYRQIEPLLQKIAAKVAADNNAPCVDYMGRASAGHFVKMVHNGIEYAEMQLIAECYDVMGRGMGLGAADISAVFSSWNEGDEGSFLIDATAQVLANIDNETGQPLVDIIMDRAGQKGTGSWTSQSALELGIGVPTISAAVDARIMSSRKTAREQRADQIAGDFRPVTGDGETIIAQLGQSLFAGRLIAFAQGFDLLREASQSYDYDLDIARICRIWREGCILRAPVLDLLADVSAATQPESSLLQHSRIVELLGERVPSLRAIAQAGVDHAIALPAMSSALIYYDAFGSRRLPANLIQAQRDFFGAHGFERSDKPGKFHGNW